MRILITTVATFFVVAFLIITARLWGMGQRFPDFQNPFFSANSPQLILKTDSIAKAFNVQQENPEAVIWLDVRLSKGNVPFVLPPERDIEFLKSKEQQQKQNPTQQIMFGSKLSDYPWDQIKDFYSGVPTLQEFYSAYPKAKFILNLVDNVTDIHLVIVDTIKDFHPDGRTFIQSDTLTLMQAVKDMKPEWVYGTSTPDLMRFLSFDSLYVLPATQFKGDVFVSPFVLIKRPAFNDDILLEMRRRHKRVFLGPIKTAEELRKAMNYKADGLIIEDLKEFAKLKLEAGL